MTAAKQPLGRTFRSGEKALHSGIYAAFDENQNCGSHNVVILAGEEFPKCARCGSAAWFALLREAPHIREDADFR